MQIPKKPRTASLILKGIVVAAATLGVCLTARATRDTFMGGGAEPGRGHGFLGKRVRDEERKG